MFTSLKNQNSLPSDFSVFLNRLGFFSPIKLLQQINIAVISITIKQINIHSEAILFTVVNVIPVITRTMSNIIVVVSVISCLLWR